VHPRNNRQTPLTGVFFTRSPDRPNPIRLHEVLITQVDMTKGILVMEPLEALDKMPIIDIKNEWEAHYKWGYISCFSNKKLPNGELATIIFSRYYFY